MSRRRHKYENWPTQTVSEEENICALCGRPLGKTTQKHHLVPKSQGGTETIPLHAICHRKIHALFNEKELARDFCTIEALLANEEIQKFVKWVVGKHPDFYRRTLRKKR